MRICLYFVWLCVLYCQKAISANVSCNMCTLPLSPSTKDCPMPAIHLYFTSFCVPTIFSVFVYRQFSQRCSSVLLSTVFFSPFVYGVLQSFCLRCSPVLLSTVFFSPFVYGVLQSFCLRCSPVLLSTVFFSSFCL